MEKPIDIGRVEIMKLIRTTMFTSKSERMHNSQPYHFSSTNNKKVGLGGEEKVSLFYGFRCRIRWSAVLAFSIAFKCLV